MQLEKGEDGQEGERRLGGVGSAQWPAKASTQAQGWALSGLTGNFWRRRCFRFVGSFAS